MATKRHLKKKTVNKNQKKVNLTKKIRKQKLKKTRINKLVGGELRKIEHIWFKGWPDKGVPQNMKEFNIFIQKIYKDMYDNGGNTVIHCSAGVGRTGVVYVVLQLLSKGNIFKDSDSKVIKTSIDTIINTERQNRNHLFVQTADQYNFIYKYFTGLDMDNYESAYKNELSQIKCIVPDDSIMSDKNRYKDVLPCKETRVKLDNEIYINASNMTPFNINGKEIKIIAAQCPKPATIKDFYEMLRKYNIKRIIMVTGLVENGGILKCEDYFGSTSTSEEYINIKGVGVFVKVTLHDKQKNDPIEIRTLTLTPDVPSSAAKPTLKISNPFFTTEQAEQAEQAEKAEDNRAMKELDLAFLALQPSNHYRSGNKSRNSRTTKEWFKLSILDKIDSYVKDEKKLGERFQIAITDKKNNTLLKQPYPEYFNKCAETKINTYWVTKKSTGIVIKTNTTKHKHSRKTQLEEIMTYGFGKEDIENFIRLQYNMPIILQTLTEGKKIEDMFKFKGDINIIKSFYENPNFELTSEVLEDTDILCFLVQEYIGLLSKIKGSYFEEEKDLNIDKNKMLIKYLSYYPKEDQELLKEIFKLFTLIMDEPETKMGPQAIGIIFMQNVEARNHNFTKDRIPMYEDFFVYIKKIYTQSKKPARPALPAVSARSELPAVSAQQPIPAPRPQKQQPIAAPRPQKQPIAAPRTKPIAAPRPKNPLQESNA